MFFYSEQSVAVRAPSDRNVFNTDSSKKKPRIQKERMVLMFHSLLPGLPANLNSVANYALPYSEQSVAVGAPSDRNTFNIDPSKKKPRVQKERMVLVFHSLFPVLMLT